MGNIFRRITEKLSASPDAERDEAWAYGTKQWLHHQWLSRLPQDVIVGLTSAGVAWKVMSNATLALDILACAMAAVMGILLYEIVKLTVYVAVAPTRQRNAMRVIATEERSRLWGYLRAKVDLSHADFQLERLRECLGSVNWLLSDIPEAEEMRAEPWLELARAFEAEFGDSVKSLQLPDDVLSMILAPKGIKHTQKARRKLYGVVTPNYPDQFVDMLRMAQAGLEVGINELAQRKPISPSSSSSASSDLSA